ncbi:MAG TPA: peptidoglycan-binding protein [Solirubrobacteraceae bacterium]|nr:peptidoglycan-binding protein [Solirubrobacteraceae bacterium]
MLLDPRRARLRDLADEEPWQLSLGRSRARRRAAELQFVPAGSRAKRISLGALAALTVGPAASVASGSTSTATGNPEPATTTENVIVLTEGSEGRQVQLLQQALGSVKVDGIFGPETEAAVAHFQERNGLAVDGVVGPQTAGALRGSGSGLTASMASVSPAEEGTTHDAVSETSSSGSGEGEGQGSTSTAGESKPDATQRLQSALKLPVDGDFGPETEAAVRRLQARHGLAVDGVVGPETWSVIGVHSEETLTPPPSALPAHHSHRHHTATVADTSSEEAGTSSEEAGASSEGGGASGNAVERLQKALKISPDGEFGPETEAAVRRLQARHGLSVDGVVGPETWALLGIHSEGELKPSAAVLHSGTSSEGGSTSATSSSSSSDGSSIVERVIAAGDEIATRPYVWGGGHGSFVSDGYDCSGSVSYALHGAGLLSSPEDSGELESYGAPGPGRDITIYANAEHAFMVVDGKRFDTVALSESGSRWSDSMTSTAGFVARHPEGL